MRDALRRWLVPLLAAVLLVVGMNATSCGIDPIVLDASTPDEEALALPDRYEVDAETSALLDVCDRHDIYVIADADMTRSERDAALQASQRLRDRITGH